MKDINDLREHLFDTIAQVKQGTMDLARAKQIADVGRVIVDSAKVEVEAMRAVGAKKGTGFLQLPEVAPASAPAARQLGSGAGQVEPNGGRSYSGKSRA